MADLRKPKRPPRPDNAPAVPKRFAQSGADDAIDRWLVNHPPAEKAPQTPPVLPTGDIPQPGQTYIPSGTDDAVAALGGGSSSTVTGSPPDSTKKDPNSTFDPTIDYSKLFDFFGLPGDIKQKIQDLIAQSKGDVSQATPLILAYIRGTDWYAQTYQGIQYGVAAGLFGANPESDYRQYVNQANQFYQQYLSRAVGTDEIVNALKEGVDVSILGKRLEGQSFANANSQDWQYTQGAFGEGGQLSQSDIKALGEESVGLKSGLGDKLQAQLDKAHQRLSTIVQGTLATQNLSRGGRGNLGSNPNQPSDIGA